MCTVHWSSPFGGKQVQSLPFHFPLHFSDIFREFNVNLTGYSTGIGNASEPNAFLNQAIPGAEAKYVGFFSLPN